MKNNCVMRNKILLFFLLVSLAVKAQISNISELASGTLELFTPLAEVDGSIYGYFTVFKLEDVSEIEEKYEYVLLDKNLNKVANGEFTDVRYKKLASSFLYPEKIKDKIILSKVHYLPYKPKFTFVTHRTLDLITNKFSKEFYYEDGSFIEGSRGTKKIKKEAKALKTFEFPIAFKEGFFLFEKLKGTNTSLKEMKSLKAFNIDKNKVWEYTYNPNEEPLDYSFSVLDDENVIFWTFNTKTKSQVFHSLDPKTGKVIFTYELENKKSDYNHLFNVIALEDTYVIIGKMSPYKSTGYDYEKAKGLFKIELSKKGNEISKEYITWEEISPDLLEIKKNGKLEDGYKLSARKFFVFKDGSASIITEKRKENMNLFLGQVNVKTTDFLILNFDKNFKLKNVETIEKEKSKWTNSDYLFSQKIKDGNGVVFFYNDHKKDEDSKKKNWVLGIVTIINGKMTHEQIPMTSEEHSIYPYVAKEGHILLREYNKDADYDQIRLERLNY